MSAPRKVCIITDVRLGENWHNDHGSAAFGLAQLLARAGEDVTLLWIPAPGARQPLSEEIESLAASFLETNLIRLKVLVASTHLHPGLERHDKASLAAYHFLRERSFDIAYFMLEGGYAHFSILAKRAGTFRNPPEIVVVANEPLDWAIEADRRLYSDKNQFTVAHMERNSAQYCDRLITSCQALKDWMLDRGWLLAKKTTTLFPLQPRELIVEGNWAARRPTNSIAFITTSDQRNGFSLFCDAMDYLNEAGEADYRISLLGPFGHELGEHSGAYFLRRSERWSFSVEMYPKLHGTAKYERILKHGTLPVLSYRAALMPLELWNCLDNSVRFIATKVGGIAEAVEKHGADQFLSAPTAVELGRTIQTVIQSCPAPRPISDRTERENRWRDFHFEDLPKKTIRRRTALTKPLVSVVIAHYERPELLQHAINSVRNQTYENIELVVVDDGSTNADAIEYLSSLETEFQHRKWKIIRQENRYLGATRNRGITQSNGDYVLFLDDDNALFPHAVSTLLSAIQESNADICTTFAYSLHGNGPPPKQLVGKINYTPVGGPTDMAILHDPYGDANALFRKEVFQKIGYLNEMRHLSASDWEFFTRAALAGLDIQVVPEPLYWYRIDTGSMNRKADFRLNRMAIVDMFRKHSFEGLSRFFELAVYSNSDKWEMENNFWNMNTYYADKRFQELSFQEPNSDSTVELLAEFASSLGRVETAIGLVGSIEASQLKRRIYEFGLPAEKSFEPDFGQAITDEQLISSEHYRTAQVGTVGAQDSSVLAYTENEPNQLLLEARDRRTVFTVIRAPISPSVVCIRAWAFLPEAVTEPAEYRLLLVDADTFRGEALDAEAENDSDSGWKTLTSPYQSIETAIWNTEEIAGDRALVFAVRRKGDQDQGQVLAGIANITFDRAYRPGDLQRPRAGAPSARQLAREWTKENQSSARLISDYPSERPLLLMAPNNDGLFVRPHGSGPVVAEIEGGFPRLASRIVGQVEIAHENSSAFEFALALKLPSQSPIWDKSGPAECVGFSGWKRVDRPFELVDISISLPDRFEFELDIGLAIRLPRGSQPTPSNAYFRKLFFAWT